MKNMLKKALGGDRQALEKAAQEIKGLERSSDGVWITAAVDENVYKAGRLVYPAYTEYDTTEGKKAGYADIAAQLTALGKRLSDSYNLPDMSCYLKLLTDTLAVMSPEIYEHYRTVLDLLRTYVKLFMEKEALCMTEFPEKCLKGETDGRDKKALSLAGEAILFACTREWLLSEKYEPLGKALGGLV